MTVTNRNSVLYAKLHVSHYLGDAGDRGGRIYPIPFSHTVVSGETGGASAAVRDTVNLCVIPALSTVLDFVLIREALAASAGVGFTLQVGDSGDDDRYMVATDSDAAGSVNGLAFAGQLYKPTADVIVLAQYRVANPVVGKIFKGFFLVIPDA